MNRTDNRITMVRPFDGHLHLRDGAMLEMVAPYSGRNFSGGIIMPNLIPAITTGPMAVAVSWKPEKSYLVKKLQE